MSKLTVVEFVRKAIVSLREEENRKAVAKGLRPSKGIHVLFSGFTAAFREYYGLPFGTDEEKAATRDTIKATMKDLVNKGIIDLIPAKMGPRMFLKGEAGDVTERDYAGEKALGLILGSAAPAAKTALPAAKSRTVRQAPPTRPAVASTDGLPLEEVAE